ncbi:MAG TPA: PQQ-binding-like beta-propeller repeat protein [Steroidobacteraceae bacterium]|nr:PQQ-binding-like beta-propeller repeat protein [Steroidobacteraceae bacterium]
MRFKHPHSRQPHPRLLHPRQPHTPQPFSHPPHPRPHRQSPGTRLLRLTAVLAIAAVPLPLPAQSDAVHAQGQAVFQRLCAVCHLSLVQTGGLQAAGPNAHAVPREMLHRYTPEAVLNALTNGKMQAQGSTLTVAERRAVAQFVTGKAFGAAAAALPVTAGRLCTQPAPAFDPAAAGWLGWGNGSANTRFQDRSRGGLTAADLPHLRLRWAFGFANVPAARTQPAVAGGRVFAASDNGAVYALDPHSGCTYWMFKAQAGVPTALSVGPYRAAGRRGWAVYFGDRKANVYAVDAVTGTQVWVRRADADKSAAITGAPALAGGRIFVPIQGIGEEGQGVHGADGCCTFRGNVVALDASTGRILWRRYTVGVPRRRGTTPDGKPIYGPSGVGIWSSPTVDGKRGLLYVATGNAYSGPAQPMSDAVIALEAATGRVRWVRQVLPGDIWAMGCDAHNAPDSGCPATLGPDYDFSASPALAHAGGHDVLVLPQKSGLAFGIDPDHGRLLWQVRIGQGSGLGGEWGAAIEGHRAFIGTADLLTRTPGGVHSINLADGALVWSAHRPTDLCGNRIDCSTGQGAALTAIPGAVLSGGMDGGLRAYAVQDGTVLWSYDTNRAFDTVNGVPAHGGSIDLAGPVVAGGMLFVTSGNGGLVGQPGNVLLAFGRD